MLSEEQTNQIKEQIIKQIESSFPEDKKIQAKEQINAMGSEQLEKFLEQNKIMRDANPGSQEGNQTQQCIFCLINSGQIESYKIDENKNSIAILEINPISKAHVLIIPKEHLDGKKIPKEVYSLAEKISKKIKTKFKPKATIMSEGTLFNHGILNLIPVYENETIDSERYQAKKEELEEVQKILKKKSVTRKKPVEKIIIKKPRKIKTKKPAKKKTTGKKPKKSLEKQWLPQRIP